MKPNRFFKLCARLSVLLAAAALIGGCETLRSLLSVERPKVTVEDVRLSALSFDGAEISVELEIENPNPIGISMDGFSYALFVEGNPFLAGDIRESIQIDASDTSRLDVPVGFGFRELLDTVLSVRERAEVAYEVAFEFRFDLPLLGEVNLPATAEGLLPVPKIPTVQLSRLSLDSISFTGAQLGLDILVRNPNAFAVELDQFEYILVVAGTPWSEGRAPRPQMVSSRDEAVISIPFSLSFASVGRTVRQLLLGNESLRYELVLQATIGTDLPLIPPLDLPFELAGSIDLTR